MNAKHLLALALTLPFAVGTAGAHENRYARARVVGVVPIYETVIVETPVTSCRQEVIEREVPSANVAGQTLAGAIVGAAIGRQFGDGRGRDALTVLGAMAGSAVANERAIRRGGGYTVVREPVERCTTTVRRHAERQITSYWVEYRLRGRNYRMQSPVRPGPEIRVQVRS